MLEEGESVTHRFDCNTVGPVPVASGYGSRTLTQSAAHVLNGSKENASVSSLSNEKRLVQSGDNDLRELSETKVGVPMTPETYSRPTRGSYAVEGVAKTPSFTLCTLFFIVCFHSLYGIKALGTGTSAVYAYTSIRFFFYGNGFEAFQILRTKWNRMGWRGTEHTERMD